MLISFCVIDYLINWLAIFLKKTKKKKKTLAYKIIGSLSKQSFFFAYNFDKAIVKARF